MKHKHNKQGFHHLSLSLLLLMLIAVGFVGWRVYENNSAGRNQGAAKNFGAWDTRIDAALGEVDCPEKPMPAKQQPGRYTGPLIDTHFHIPSLPDSLDFETEGNGDTNTRPVLGVNSTISRIVCTLKQEGTSKVFAWFSVFPEIDEQSVEVVRRVMVKYPDKFVPFIMPPDHDDRPDGSPTVDAKTLVKMLNYEPGLFKGYGEIGLYAREGGSKALPPDSARLQKIYEVVREHKLMVFFHLGEGQQASFERVLKANRDIKFLFHGDQLIPYENGKQNLSQIDQILSRNPNAFYGVDELYGDDFILKPEVGEKDFLAHFDNYEPLLAEDVSTWKAFIERHPDQVMWDTDRGWSSPWSMDYAAGYQLTDYARAFIAKLDPAVQEKYAYKNAERILTSD